MSDPGLRAVSVLGFAVMIAVAWVCSSDRRHFPWRVVLSGSALQLAIPQDQLLLLVLPRQVAGDDDESPGLPRRIGSQAAGEEGRKRVSVPMAGRMKPRANG